uniref:Uncharacterized protein n=1 Tax=viral metagenome TaxID=1070528 RepID=A0A6C0EDY1_9ZZZZ
MEILYDELIDNPLTSNVSLIYFDESSESNIEISYENISKYFKYIFILIKKNNYIITSDFYNYKISKKLYDEVSDNLILYRCSVNILKNKMHYNNILILNNENLLKYNIFNYKLNNKNIVLPILNIEFSNIIQYLEQYDINYTLNNFYNLKILNNYFQYNDTYSTNNYLCNFINNLNESNYWINCKSIYPITNYFTRRKFVIQLSRMADNNLADIIKTKVINQLDIKPHKNSDHNSENNNEIDYLNEINSKNNFIDISCSIDKKIINNDFVDISDQDMNLNFTKNDINNLFNHLDIKQKYLLFSHLIISKKYCHLVVNNIYLLKMMDETLKKFSSLFRYLLSYAWISFYSDECIKKSNVVTTDDFIFDINTAAALPLFSFDHTKPKENPYMPILVRDWELKPLENFCGIPEYCNSKYNNQGICNLEQFQERLNIFCTGKINFNIFENFDFQKYNVAISGSVMTACIQKSHPLLSRFKIINNNESYYSELYNNYFDEYYSKSDVDIIFKATNEIIFYKNAKIFYDHITNNICKFNNLNNKKDIKFVVNKIGYLFVSEEFINKNINLDNSNKIQYIIDNINNIEIKNIFRPFYEKMIEENYHKLILEYSDNLDEMINSYPEIFKKDINIDFKIYINKNKSNNQNLELKYTYKFHIISKYIKHNLELFSIINEDFFGVVTNFHMPCVRAYYNGNNVYLTPSCITAHLTYMNIDYKYITGTKDPCEIINKNRLRGFGTWLNKNEIQLMIKYCSNVPYWKNLYSDYIVGPISLNHKLFRPRLYNIDYNVENQNSNSDNLQLNDKYNNINLGDVIYKPNKIIPKVTNNLINFSKLLAIDSWGRIIPVKKWIILTTWNMYNEI